MLWNAKVTSEGAVNLVQATATESAHNYTYKLHIQHQNHYSAEPSEIIHFYAFFSSIPFHFLQSNKLTAQKKSKQQLFVIGAEVV